MIEYTIKGEAGKTWDATTQTFAYRAITPEAQFVFKSVGMDVFNFTVRPETLSASSAPDLGQKIIVYRGGVQFFHGTVIDVRPTYGTTDVKVTVAGPWWFMDQIPMTGLQTDGEGNDEERVSYVFGTPTAGQQLKTSIESLINRMIALGVPLQLGTVATFHEYPRITLNQMSCAQAFTELLRIAPDSMSWFDYSTTPATLHVTRRAPQTAVELAVGTDPIADIQLAPRLDLQVKKVVLPYVERSATGVNKYLKQESDGTAGPGTSDPDKIQVLAMSGPELDTFLPNDEFDSVFVKIGPITRVDIIPKAISEIGNYTGTYGLIDLYTNSQTITSASYYGNGLLAQLNWYNAGGLATKSGNANVIAFGEVNSSNSTPPDWLVKQMGLVETEIVGGVYSRISSSVPTNSDQRSDFYTLFSDILWNDGVYSGYYCARNYSQEAKKVWTSASLPTTSDYHTYGTSPSAGTRTTIKLSSGASSVDGHYIGSTVTFTGADFSVLTATITAYNGSTKTATFAQVASGKEPKNGYNYIINGVKVYRDADYSFIKPPAGFAQFLKDCQDFIIYEGEVVLTQEDVGATRYSGKVINITGAFPAYSTMKAMVSGEILDVGTGTTTIELGCAERLNYRTAVDRIRKTSQDNIFYL